MKILNRAFNFASPSGWILAALALAAFCWLLIVAAGGLGFRFDPFNTAEQRADRAESTAAVATSNAGARSAEAAGANDTTTKVETAQSRIHAAEAVIARTNPAAKAAPDADQDLEADRLARHNDVTRQLCDVRPAVCPGYAAASADAGDGRSTLRPDVPPDRSVPL